MIPKKVHFTQLYHHSNICFQFLFLFETKVSLCRLELRLTLRLQASFTLGIGSIDKTLPHPSVPSFLPLLFKDKISLCGLIRSRTCDPEPFCFNLQSAGIAGTCHHSRVVYRSC